MLDGAELGVLDEIDRSVKHAIGIRQVLYAKMQSIGRKLHVEVTIRLDGGLSIIKANKNSSTLEGELFECMTTLAVVSIQLAGGV